MWLASKRQTIPSREKNNKEQEKKERKENTISPNDFLIANSVDELFGLNTFITYLLCFCVDMF